jgi:hypothetical protein
MLGRGMLEVPRRSFRRRIEAGESLLNLAGYLAGEGEFDQRTMVKSGTVLSGLVKLGAAGEQLRPEGEGATLQRLDGMDRTSVGEQEGTLQAARYAQAH